MEQVSLPLVFKKIYTDLTFYNEEKKRTAKRAKK
jgi:hypothetical protein